MLSRKEENTHLNGFVMGVLRSAEFASKYGNNPLMAQNLINDLLDKKMKFLFIKRMAKNNKIDLDWNSMDITVKRTD